MPRKKQPKFKVGDVIQWDVSRVTPEEFISFKAKPEDRGVITRIEDWTVGNYFYHIEWFSRLEETVTIFYSRLKLCDGMKNKDLCEQCRYRFHCWTTRRR